MGCYHSHFVDSNSIDRENIGKAFSNLKSKSFYNEIDLLRSCIEGEVILPIDEQYDLYQEARTRPFNVEFRGFPLVITRPKHTEDVSKIINFVREKCEAIPLCIQCGGHSTRCMVTDSFAIDLVYMKNVQLDMDNMLIHADGGAYLKELDDAMKPYNVATPVGTYPLTGVGGLVLAGGYGYLSKLHGMSVDNLVEIEVVLADGRIVVANDSNEYSDLIWGCRGGGGNFGIVTKFTFRLHKMPTSVLGGMRVYLAPTLASAKQVYRSLDEIVSTLPDEVTTLTVFAAGEPVVPTLLVYFGDKASVKEVPALNVSPKGAWLRVLDSVKPVSYHSDIQTITQPMNPPGHFSYTSLVQVGNHLEVMPESFYDEILKHTRKSLHKSLIKAVCIMFTIGGKMRTADDGSKTSINEAVRHARYFLIIESIWKGQFGEEGRCAARDWAKETVRISSKYQVSPMLHAPDAINDSVVMDAVKVDMISSINLNDVGSHDLGFAGSVLDRLRTVKGKYDPNNFFRLNANILPK